MRKTAKQNRFRKDVRESVVDVETGQVVHSKEKTTFFPPKFDPDKGYLFWTHSSGARVFSNVPYPNGMSKADIGNLAILGKNIWSKTNLLGKKKRGDVHPYSVKEIGEILDLSEEQAERFLKRAFKFGVIKPIPVPFGDCVEIQYYMNPLYYFAGSRLSPNLYLLFRKELDAHLQPWVKEEFAKAIAGKDLEDKEEWIEKYMKGKELA